MKKFALGVDIGGTNSKFGLVDAEGELHYSNSIKTNTAATPTRLVNAIYQEIKEKNNSSVAYYKKIIKASEEELKLHKEYLKVHLKKNFFN